MGEEDQRESFMNSMGISDADLINTAVESENQEDDDYGPDPVVESVELEEVDHHIMEAEKIAKAEKLAQDILAAEKKKEEEIEKQKAREAERERRAAEKMRQAEAEAMAAYERQI